MYSRYCTMFMMICSIVVAGILFSCNDYAPIFASIENEELIKTSNLPDGATTLGMAKLNNTYYVATGGAMYQRNVDTEKWDRTSLPSSYEGVSSLVRVNEDTAYVILIKDYYVDISGYALYRMEVKNKNVTFSRIRTRNAGAGAIVRLFAVDGIDNVYAVVDDNSGYRYYQHYQNPTPEKLEGGCNKDRTSCHDLITGVAQMGDSGGVYISTQTELFTLQSDSDTLTKVDVKEGTTSLKGWIGGIYYSKAYKKLYLSNKQYIWTLDKGSAVWKSSSKESNTFFTSFIDIEQTGFNGVLVGTRFYLGTKGRDAGYREIKKGDIGSISTPIGNKYTSGNLDTAGVLGFFLDDNTLFVFTNARGLWRGTYTNGRNVDWFLE